MIINTNEVGALYNEKRRIKVDNSYIKLNKIAVPNDLQKS